jgi:hypothetical protein
MEQHHHDGQSDQHTETPVPNRRKFLRQAGMTAAATAAVVGAADAFGLTPAFASAKQTAKAKPATPYNVMPFDKLPASTAKRMKEIRAVHPDSVTCCDPQPGHCNGPCHPSSVWCHLCCNSLGYCWHSCLYGDYSFCT